MIWHYTYDENFAQIREDGLIRAADAFIGKGEKPIVWFSKEQFWEPTVIKGWRLDDGTVEQLRMDGMMENGTLLMRIGVDLETAPFSWSEMKSLSGMSTATASGLASRAKELGSNPSRWRGSFEPVPRSKWKAVEYLNPGADEWTAFPEEAWFPEETTANQA